MPPNTTQRAWCLFEIYTSLRLSKPIQPYLCPSDEAHLNRELQAEGLTGIASSVIEGIAVEQARAFSEQDLANILNEVMSFNSTHCPAHMPRKFVHFNALLPCVTAPATLQARSYPGGFDAINQVVRDGLRRWLGESANRNLFR